MIKIAAFAANLFTTVSVTSTAMALPGLPGNGGELTGVPAIVGQTAEDDVVSAPNELGLLTFNGPELTGIPIIIEEVDGELSLFGLGDGTCQPWQCGVNGPELTAVEVRSHAGGPRVEDFESVKPDSAHF